MHQEVVFYFFLQRVHKLAELWRTRSICVCNKHSRPDLVAFLVCQLTHLCAAIKQIKYSENCAVVDCRS